MTGLFYRQLRRELIYHCSAPRQLIQACLFFLMTLLFFPLTISSEPQILRTLAPGLIWIVLLFSLFLSSEQLFQQDYEDGILEQWLISGESISIWVNAKMLVHWMMSVIPLLCLCPLIGLLLSLTLYETWTLVISLICGTPAILALCALASVFSTASKQKGMLMALIIFPLAVPIMIFGSSTLTSAMLGLPVEGYLAILGAISLLAIGFLPIAISTVVKLSLVE